MIQKWQLYIAEKYWIPELSTEGGLKKVYKNRRGHRTTVSVTFPCGSILWTFLRWVFKLEDLLLRYWHKWQANGFSPVWILIWTSKLEYLLDRKLHNWQAWGFVSNSEATFWYWNNTGYTLFEIVQFFVLISNNLYSFVLFLTEEA